MLTVEKAFVMNGIKLAIANNVIDVGNIPLNFSKLWTTNLHVMNYWRRVLAHLIQNGGSSAYTSSTTQPFVNLLREVRILADEMLDRC